MSKLDRVEKMEKELAALKQEIKDEQEWPQEGDEYHWINGTNDVFQDVFTECFVDLRRKNSENMKRTKEEAEQKALWRQVIDELWAYAKEVNDGWEPNWSNCTQNKYRLAYDHRNNRFTALVSARLNYLAPHFRTEELANNAITHFGDRLNILRDYRG